VKWELQTIILVFFVIFAEMLKNRNIARPKHKSNVLVEKKDKSMVTVAVAGLKQSGPNMSLA
jgi:biopolymer transport protein ExbD